MLTGWRVFLRVFLSLLFRTLVVRSLPRVGERERCTWTQISTLFTVPLLFIVLILIYYLLHASRKCSFIRSFLTGHTDITRVSTGLSFSLSFLLLLHLYVPLVFFSLPVQLEPQRDTTSLEISRRHVSLASLFFSQAQQSRVRVTLLVAKHNSLSKQIQLFHSLYCTRVNTLAHFLDA